jgi:hypothetical protein
MCTSRSAAASTRGRVLRGPPRNGGQVRPLERGRARCHRRGPLTSWTLIPTLPRPQGTERVEPSRPARAVEAQGRGLVAHKTAGTFASRRPKHLALHRDPRSCRSFPIVWNPSPTPSPPLGGCIPARQRVLDPAQWVVPYHLPQLRPSPPLLDVTRGHRDDAPMKPGSALCWVPLLGARSRLAPREEGHGGAAVDAAPGRRRTDGEVQHDLLAAGANFTVPALPQPRSSRSPKCRGPATAHRLVRAQSPTANLPPALTSTTASPSPPSASPAHTYIPAELTPQPR